MAQQEDPGWLPIIILAGSLAFLTFFLLDPPSDSSKLRVPSLEERRRILEKIVDGRSQEAMQDLFTAYGYTEPFHVLSPEDVLRDGQYEWLMQDLFVLPEYKDLRKENSGVFEAWLLKSGGNEEMFLGIIPQGSAGRLGLTLPSQFEPGDEEYEGPTFLFSRYGQRDPVVFLHEFWEYAGGKEGEERSSFDVHRRGEFKDAWVKAFLEDTPYAGLMRDREAKRILKDFDVRAERRILE